MSEDSKQAKNTAPADTSKTEKSIKEHERLEVKKSLLVYNHKKKKNQ